MKVVIFDFDGVIVDSFSASYRSWVLSFKGLSEEDFKARLLGNIYENKFEKKLKEESREGLFGEYKKRLLFIPPNEDVSETLQKLKKKYLLFINSSAPEEALNEYIKKYKLNGLFEEVLGYNFSKSKVIKFKYLFEKYDLKREDCIFVTDTLGDIREANEVGLKTIAVDFGFHDREVLEKGKPLKIISEFKDLLEM